MEYRTVALLVAIVLAFAASTILMPKPPTGFDDSWECPPLASARVRLKKAG
jgi:hypothetical protein